MMSERVWPLVFSYRGLVRGNGFSAIVDAVCRVLAEEQDSGGIWMNGAEPGGFAAGGDDIDSAHAAFTKMFRDILTDTAEEMDGFDGFRNEMTRFFEDIDRGVNRAWLKAWEDNRKGTLDCEPLQWMIRATGDENRSRVQIERVQTSGSVHSGELEVSSPAVERTQIARGRRRSDHEFARIAA